MPLRPALYWLSRTLGVCVALLALPAQATEIPACQQLPPAPVAFRFGTGSRPAAPPAVSPDGQVYVGTSEGYVHALDANGGYLWSYTLRGPVSGRPVVGTSGALLVPTRRRIYAIRPDGSLLWAFDSPVAVLGDLVRDGLGRYNFVSDDGRLFSLSGAGALVAHVPQRGLATALPVAVGSGVAVGYESGAVVWSRPAKTQRFQLGAAVRALSPCPGAELCALAGGKARRLGAQGGSWEATALRIVGTERALAVLSDDRHLTLFGEGGAPRFALTLPDAVSAAPLLDERGRLFLPLKSGALLAISERGEPLACTEVARSPLGTPVADSARQRVVVTALEGVLAAIDVK